MDYGPKFDRELEKLLWEFLIRLDQLLPVPNLAQALSTLFITNHTSFIIPAIQLHAAR